MTLAKEKCQRIEAGTVPLSSWDIEQLAPEVPAWTIKDGALEREFQFQDFPEAMEFVGDVAELAQRQDHHPDIHILYNKVRLVFSTHKIGGLSRNDFIMAAKVDHMVGR
jgi:4a-hydroxytetrahydrobiopterin dehydratase